MTPIGTRWAAATLAAAAVWGAPVAAAVTPPQVDDARLPPARPPAPPTTTEQTGACPASVRSDDIRAVDSISVDLRAVWPLTRGAGQAVAVIDTGVSPHRLLPHLVPGGDYVSTGDGTQDCDGHGTIVAGIIGATPVETAGSTFGGVAPDAGVIAIRQSSNVFRPSEGAAGSGVGDVDTLAMAIRTAADAGASVINVSSVACMPADEGIDDRSLGAALAYAVDVKNVVVVAAAGNVGGPGQCPEQNPGSDPALPGRPNWDTVKVVASPAWYDDYVLTVGSVDRAGRPSSFTLGGPWVDVAARGEAIVSVDPGGEGLTDRFPGSPDGQPISGTSYSAPVVSGLAALVRAAWPRLSARQVMQRIEDTAHRPSGGWDPLVGHGVVDLLAAVSGNGTLPPPTAVAAPSVSVAPNEAATNTAGRRVAYVGAALCLAVATAATTFSAGRSRRRREAIPHD